jgi:tetratricopeptide (TPR) repeat protein
VAHFSWVDDFAAARNAALDLSRADWHLVLDADEWVASGGEAIAALRQQRPAFVGQVCVNSAQDANGVRTVAPSWISRVLPGTVRYAGAVHEQPQHALPVRPLPLVLGHDGYLSAALASKRGRNAALLQQALDRSPDNAYLWYQLGKDHDVYGQHAQALACMDRAVQLMPSPPPAWAHDLTVRSLHALKKCQRYPEAVERADNAMRTWPGSPDVYFATGDLLLDWAAEEPQRADELVPMIEAAWLRCLDIGERPDLEGSVAGRGSTLAAGNLALLYDMLGQGAQAASCRALANEPAKQA